MFQKVLIAEDQETINYSLQKTLQELGIENDTRNYVYYCDDALARLKKALTAGQPYELLITDLSFDDDHTTQQLTDGSALINAAKAIQPNLKVLVFSIENRFAVAQRLFKQYDINGFVPKGRRDGQDLKLAIETIYKNGNYLSGNLKKEKRDETNHQFSHFEKTIISLLAEGISQKNIPTYLKEKNIVPSGLSSVEKKLSVIKTVLGFNTNEQLVAYCKDEKII